ncbi:branched-chain amino acid aminotransferase [Telluribacter humicola]|uniref:branched-chain amino acid aminotransferase n=1 Tax=Telluribacter humicola TaxID=1720261 RepID=UPI001A9641EE|nr:branched-chain amino acid aminotransferase [Telluribacter humicola]
MEAISSIHIESTPRSRINDVDISKALFGSVATDHMFVADYAGSTWNNSQIKPFSNLSLSPFALALHYGQTVFEGMKAFRMHDGSISLFRPDKHYQRFCRSLERMCMPLVTEELFVSALHELVSIDRQWVPVGEDSSLYLRPFMIASEAKMGVKVSDEYLFMVVGCPTGPYYSKPLRLKVETQYIRSAEGGTGYAKCGGNYGGAFYPTVQANHQGFDQVLWTDGKENRYLEESGTMNVMLITGNTLITPPLSFTILDGVTRDSILTMARDNGMDVQERKVSVDELEQVLASGKNVELFGTGTAAVIAPIKEISIGESIYSCYIGEDSTMYSLKQQLLDIRTGKAEDLYGWNYILA